MKHHSAVLDLPLKCLTTMITKHPSRGDRNRIVDIHKPWIFRFLGDLVEFNLRLTNEQINLPGLSKKEVDSHWKINDCTRGVYQSRPIKLL
jgi:hypothetical protein